MLLAHHMVHASVLLRLLLLLLHPGTLRAPASAGAAATVDTVLLSAACILLVLQGHCRLLLQLGLLPHGGRHLLRGQGALLPSRPAHL
jgi:hypothetical protein